MTPLPLRVGYQIPERARPLIGPDAQVAGMLDWSLRHPREASGRGGSHVCTLEGDAVRWARTLPAGGVVCCEHCLRPVFIAPAEPIDDEPDAEITIERGSTVRRWS